MPRFTVVAHPARKGYAIRDSQPRLQHGEDVEGVGWIQYSPPRQLPPTFGFYRRRCDAQHRADVLNAAGCGPG